MYSRVSDDVPCLHLPALFNENLQSVTTNRPLARSSRRLQRKKHECQQHFCPETLLLNTLYVSFIGVVFERVWQAGTASPSVSETAKVHTFISPVELQKHVFSQS